jgi:hypothetical protein
MEISFLEWIGYIASGIIALSMTMNSILRFRWINLVGAVTFSIYGFLIGALPVGFLNLFIALVDIYYLYAIYSKKEIFETLEIQPESNYMERFLKFHEKDIQLFFPGFAYLPNATDLSFFILRDMAIAGIFIAHRQKDNSLEVSLDYVIPEYRDFKNGKFVFLTLRNKLMEDGITKIVATAQAKKHERYLKKLGFIQLHSNCYEKSLTK